MVGNEASNGGDPHSCAHSCRSHHQAAQLISKPHLFRTIPTMSRMYFSCHRPMLHESSREDVAGKGGEL